jgi:predicted GNAT family N-acyltransferase
MSPAILKVRDSKFLPLIGSLRYQVWSAETDEFPNVIHGQIWLDPLDDVADHFIVLAEGQLVAAARITYHDSLDTIPDLDCYESIIHRFRFPIASFNRLVVSAEFRGCGISRLLVKARLHESIKKAKSAVCIGQREQARRLTEFGFENCGIAPKLDPITKILPGHGGIMFCDLSTIRPEQVFSQYFEWPR